ncbi:hypothetical protein HNQ80_005043 [Anaerosolibacter carboniphilus]|uniref:Uncharacterized protein n=1 Tax=Anaerosolibacter carboniphilus TaxID=1417629 RepID=A0A841L2L0_9FIRM|nr:hypothetical protein [Anaerosolibacter carboniphilus]MBB6218868.1 hypothetical protein [Anaerosolibacter carboniphilus]
MDSLAKKFLEEDATNKDLYIQGIIFKNDSFLDVFNQKFNDYLFLNKKVNVQLHIHFFIYENILTII